MKIQILSDLHMEFFNSKKESKEFIDGLISPVDVIVLAGDIGTKSNIIDILSQFCDNYPHVVYVAGNHEYYNSGFKFIHDELDSIKNSNFHFLNNSSVEIENQRFIGSTMWFADIDQCNRFYRHMLNDFSRIMDLHRIVYQINDESTLYLKENVNNDDIVVTHHMPLEDSIALQYKGNDFNRFFLCNMEETIIKQNPKIWIHGHTHNFFDYVYEKTRVVCNPFGYNEVDENREFIKHLIINNESAQ